MIVVSGLAGSTLTLQRSFSEPGSWIDVETYTADGTYSFDDGLDNQIYFYRVGIKTGGYGGDTVIATLQHSGSQTGIVRVRDLINYVTVTADVIEQLGSAGIATADWSEGEWSIPPAGRWLSLCTMGVSSGSARCVIRARSAMPLAVR